MKRSLVAIPAMVVILLASLVAIPVAYGYTSDVVATATIKVTINDSASEVIVVDPTPDDGEDAPYVAVELPTNSGENGYIIKNNDTDKTENIGGDFNISITLPSDKKFMVKITLTYVNGTSSKNTPITIKFNGITYNYKLEGTSSTATYYLGTQAVGYETDKKTGTTTTYYGTYSEFNPNSCFSGNSSAVMIGKSENGTNYKETLSIIFEPTSAP